MHQLQKKLLEKSTHHDLGGMTLREIGELIGEQHPQKVKHHLDQLKRKGYLRESHDGLLLRSSDTEGSFTYIPIRGRANCGEAMAIAEDQIDGYLTVSNSLVPRKVSGLYALKAVGDSMNQAQIGPRAVSINEGDYIIVSGEARTPSNGDYVVSLIDGAANVKKFSEDEDRIVLISQSNKNYPPIIIDKTDYDPGYMIAGRVVEVIKGVQSS